MAAVYPITAGNKNRDASRRVAGGVESITMVRIPGDDG
jgi:hypothetical protein